MGVNALVIAAQVETLGRTVTLVEPGALTYDPVTDTGTRGADVEHEVAGALRAVDARYVNGVDVLASDSQLVLGTGACPEPTVGWRVEADGRSWNVVQVRKPTESWGASADWTEATGYAGWTLLLRGASE